MNFENIPPELANVMDYALTTADQKKLVESELIQFPGKAVVAPPSIPKAEKKIKVRQYKNLKLLVVEWANASNKSIADAAKKFGLPTEDLRGVTRERKSQAKNPNQIHPQRTAAKKKDAALKWMEETGESYNASAEKFGYTINQLHERAGYLRKKARKEGEG